ncbi:TRAP transporter TatT component family protein [Pseudomarimonas salicorniae]|uniref:TRAP transporter TatT component family protein n=1 Tax=Pseudomarimonas salicorniae TaxID=2933270 RepID=A0ABT0GEK5_9GAMM|nr:TRAP transporter TatT component family protein [Lysobacter sp. CAU 1642]MCK7592983.1 TRAP transporter TatT component family protein [Lysobacter sp. CAU 1642]
MTPLRWLIACLGLLAIAGCASLLRPVGSGLDAGIRNHDDPATVSAALPAYLVLLDGLIEGRSDSAPLLSAAASLYGTYSGSFIDEPERAKRLSGRGFGYARRLACLDERSPLCRDLDGPVDRFVDSVAAHPAKDVETLYVLGSSWTGYIQAHSDDFRAIAALPKAQALLERVAAEDPRREQGMVFVYLGVLHSLRPSAVGGQPERGRAAFERAIVLSSGANLMAKTLFAQYYARLLFERPLHDRLVDEVLSADPVAPGLTLANTLAQERARQLKETADEFF